MRWPGDLRGGMSDAEGPCPEVDVDPGMIDDLFRGEGHCSRTPGLDGLRALVREARAPGSEGELRDREEVVARMVAAARPSRPGSTDPRGGENQGRMRMFGKRRIARVAPVVAATAAVLGGGAAAAAAGAWSSPLHGAHAAAIWHVRGAPQASAPAAPSAPAVRLAADDAAGRASTGRPWTGPGAFGKVTSVDGSTAAAGCGVAGGTGSFVVANSELKTITTVDVSSSTKFYAPRASGASFADVCVGDFAAAQGTAGGTGTITATSVFVATPPPARVIPPAAFTSGFYAWQVRHDPHWSGAPAPWTYVSPGSGSQNALASSPAPRGGSGSWPGQPGAGRGPAGWGSSGSASWGSRSDRDGWSAQGGSGGPQGGYAH